MSTEEAFPNREGTLQAICSASKMSARKWMKERRRWTCRCETEVEMVTMMGMRCAGSAQPNGAQTTCGFKFTDKSTRLEEEWCEVSTTSYVPRRNAGRARIGSKILPGSGICDDESKCARTSRWINCPMKSGPPERRGMCTALLRGTEHWDMRSKLMPSGAGINDESGDVELLEL